MRSRPLGLILAGGRSERLFPLKLPKPLLCVGRTSLLENAVARLKGFDIRIITNQETKTEIQKKLRKKKFKYYIEPEGRDTAAAVGYGVRKGLEEGYTQVAILSADQWIPGVTQFRKFIGRVLREIDQHPESLFVAGSPAHTKPTESHSQFGWIVPQSRTKSSSFIVSEFKEKPQGARLRKIKLSGGLINAGMFFGRLESFFAAYQEYYPKVMSDKLSYARLERQPVDRAIFEKYPSVRALRLPVRWEDLGTWEDWKTHTPDNPPSLVSVGSKNLFVRSSKKLEIYSFGVADLAIIEEAGRFLVMPLKETRKLKSYLNRLRKKRV